MPIEVKTPDSKEYIYFPIPSTPSTLRFKVKAAHDAHILLCEKPSPGLTEPVIEVVIGAGKNTYSTIRRNWAQGNAYPYVGNYDPAMASVKTPGICSENEFRGFWINYLGGDIQVGRENETKPFLSWKDPNPIKVSHFGVHTGWGAIGEWVIGDTWNKLRAAAWMAVPGKGLPANSVVGAYEDEKVLYVGRARLNQAALIPGKVAHSKEGNMVCFVTWDGAEHKKSLYEILIGGSNLKWEPSAGEQVPHDAVVGGFDSGETLYIGRVQKTLDGKHINSIGKVSPRHGVCYIFSGGKELSFPEYEILVQQ